MHYDLDRDVSNYLDLMYSNTLLPQITTPSRITYKWPYIFIRKSYNITFWSSCYSPLKKVSNSQKKNQSKPWITQGILKSTAVKNRLHRKMCRAKDIMRRTELKKNIKHYKNNLAKLTRTSKTNYYNKVFKENKLSLLKTWNGIREIINIRPI